MYSINAVESRIGLLPRIRLTELPTPLEELGRLAEVIGGPRLFMKRDDLTTLALGGNKVRKLEFAIGDAITQQADTIVTGGAVQSNHCRLTAAAAAKIGMGCVLILAGEEEKPPQGNLLLDRLFGAEVRFTNSTAPADADRIIPKVAEELRARGKHPYTLYVVGGSDTVFGVIGYVQAYLELATQLDRAGVRASHLCVCAGSGATQAGLLLGAKLLGHSIQVLGISIRRGAVELRARIREAVSQAAGHLGYSVELSEEEIRVYDQFVGSGYGALSPELRDTITLLARTSGILIDHVYAGKTLAGLRELVASGELGKADTVVFVHTGGVPSLFAYPDQLLGG